MSGPVYMHASIAIPGLVTNHCPGNGLNHLCIVACPDAYIIFPSSCSNYIHQAQVVFFFSHQQRKKGTTFFFLSSKVLPLMSKPNATFVLFFFQMSLTNQMLYWFGQVLISYLPNPSARAGYDTRSIFKRSLTGLSSEFSFSLTSCLTKAEEPSLSYYLPITGGRIIGFIPFPSPYIHNNSSIFKCDNNIRT